MKIIITGGHLTPALAVIEELEQRAKESQEKLDLLFVGRKYPYEGETTLSEEYKTITKKNIPFISLSTGKLTRNFSLKTLVNLLKIPFAIFTSIKILKHNRPDIVLSFGGYLSFPVCLAAYLLRIPIITHEQTFVSGLSNKIISLFAKTVCLSYPMDYKKKLADKYVITGNPVRLAIFQKNKPSNLGIEDVDKVIYLTGGNLGSHSINMVIKELLPEILNKYVLIHQTGDSATYHDFDQFSEIKNHLPVAQKQRYYLEKYINQDDIGWILNRADLIISRSGANIVSEILALGKVSLLIPLPWAGGHEQEINAYKLEEWGSALVLKQNILTPDTLWVALTKIENNYQSLLTAAQNLKSKSNLQAAKLIADEIEKIIKK